jgi:hypothetical protein
MTKSEREDLLRLVRQQEKVSKTHAKQRAAEMLAEFERQVSAIYHFDQDETWAEAKRIAEEAVINANGLIAERCQQLGIPNQFAPSLREYWFSRGQNATKERRDELRKLAIAKIAALESAARSEIERRGLEAATEIVAHGLESGTARAFLERFKVQELMPSLNVGEVENLLKDKSKNGRFS